MTIFDERPFKIRNADEFELNKILGLFVNPSLDNPFEYENNIIKGRMGSGKTMYLRANYVFYLYSIIPSLLENKPIILPVFLRLSDFQHLNKPEDIYRQVIIQIIGSISKVYLELKDCEKMALIHQGVKVLPIDVLKTKRFEVISDKLLKMNSEEYIEMINKNIKNSGNVTAKFFEISATYEKEHGLEIKNKPNPGIADVQHAYEYLLKDKKGQILLLIDEAAALDKSFFRSRELSQASFFEILMNQLRTSEFIRTKIAVYPNSFSDILAETRYGDVVILEDNIMDENGYNIFRSKAVSLINNYLKTASGKKIEAYEVFDIDTKLNCGDCLEQLINASEGNLRRLVQLLDLSMIEAQRENRECKKASLNNAIEALKKIASNMESLYTPIEIQFLENVAKACRRRGAFRFKFPLKSPILFKYTSKSEEQNLLKVIEIGSGRRGTTYAFDYAYSVLRDIPTHFLKATERIDKERSIRTGNWSTRVVTISEEIIAQAELPGKIEGEIDYITEDKESGFVKTDDGKDYFFSRKFVIEDDRRKSFIVGKRLRFFPTTIQDSLFAVNVEVL